MTLEALGNAGEMIGGVGVILSLVYLAAQIRQNTRSVRTGNYQDVVATAATLSATVGSNAETSRIFWGGLTEPDSLTLEESRQFAMLLTTLFRVYENLFYQHHENMLDTVIWTGWSKNALQVFWLPGAQVWWQRWRETYHPDFRAFLESSVQDTTDGGIRSVAREGLPS